MIILGLNIQHGDSSACLIKNGKLMSAVEEERFTRIKNCSEFPFGSINFCLQSNNIGIQDVDFISINSDYKYNLINKIIFLLKNLFKISFLASRSESVVSKKKIKKKIEGYFKNKIKAEFIFVSHHLAHAFSTLFFLKKNKNSIIFSFDGSGDFSTNEVYLANENRLELVKKNIFPHSFGLFYTAFTQFLGFEEYGDEYKFMGLAAYGKPVYYDDVKKLILSQDPFKLDMKYFNLPKIDYSNKKPKLNRIFSEKFYDFFKKKYNFHEINYDSQISQNIACSVQRVFEECVLLNLHNLSEKYNSNKLYLTGGCSFNSLLVGKIIQSKIFKDVEIGPNPGDAGGAVGSAFYACINKNIKIEPQQEERFVGPSFSNDEIKKEVIDKIFSNKNYTITFFKNFEDISKKTSQLIKSEGIVFWFQDRMEWGPRALGNRSILADPSKEGIKEFINKSVKKRELYRPFAPAIMEDFAEKYFWMNGNLSPNMNIVFQAREETKKKYPGAVHVDHTSRVQTVSEINNKKFYNLMKNFYEISQCPMLINTSFNINAPIAMSPEHAWNIFCKTNVRSLILGNWLIEKKIISQT